MSFDLAVEAETYSRKKYNEAIAEVEQAYQDAFLKALELIEAHFKEEWKFYSDTKFFELQKFINKLKSGGR